MRYRFLGNSGLQVSEICFGVMTFNSQKGWIHLGVQEQKDANRLTSVAIEQGVNFFDTADVYSNGISESMLGKALGRKRKDVVIATKGEGRMGNGPNDEGHSRQHLIKACEDSLKRLNTDYIDLYQGFLPQPQFLQTNLILSIQVYCKHRHPLLKTFHRV